MEKTFSEDYGITLLKEVETNLSQTALNYRKSGDPIHVYLDDQRFKISMAIKLLKEANKNV